MQYALQFVGLYVGLNILLNLALAFIVSTARVRADVMTGEGSEDTPLYRAGRAHTLNVEYTPIGLIGLIALYVLASSIYLIHAVGILLTLGRVLHAVGLLQTSGTSMPRLIGTLATWLALLLAGLGCLFYAIWPA